MTGKDRRLWTVIHLRAINRIARVWKAQHKVTRLPCRSSLAMKREHGGWQWRKSCTPPRGEHRSTIAVAEVQMKKLSEKQSDIRARKNATEGMIWPLHEGREIWGADGTFASKRMVIKECRGWHPHHQPMNWRDSYKGFRQSAHPEAFPMCHSYAGSSEPSPFWFVVFPRRKSRWVIYCLGFKPGLYFTFCKSVNSSTNAWFITRF